MEIFKFSIVTVSVFQFSNIDNVQFFNFENAAGSASQSNGEIENSVKKVEGQIRTMKMAIEDRYDMIIGDEHNVLPWLVRHAAQSINRYTVLDNGKTPYMMIKGRRFRRKVVKDDTISLFFIFQ